MASEIEVLKRILCILEKTVLELQAEIVKLREPVSGDEAYKISISDKAKKK
jgi:hypothetical protein